MYFQPTLMPSVMKERRVGNEHVRQPRHAPANKFSSTQNPLEGGPKDLTVEK